MRYLFVLLLLAAIATAGVYFASPTNEEREEGPPSPQMGGIYNAFLAEDPPTLDPAVVEDTTSVSCVLQLFDTLVRFGEGNRLVPSLAKKWEISEDQKTYTFELRRNIHFHQQFGDGRPTKNGGREVTAQDFVYSFQRVLDPKTNSPRSMLFQLVEGAKDFVDGKAKNISGLRAAGKYVLHISLTKPFAPFLATLTMPNTSVVPKEDVEGDKGFAKWPVGTGPFIFKSYTQGKEVVFSANTTYFAGRPYLDELRFVIDPDEETMFRLFLSGKVFHTTVPDPEYIRTRTSTKWAPYFTEVSQLGTFYIGMNVRHKPFDNEKVRRAISMAVDKEAIVKYIRAGRVHRAKGPLPPGIPGYNTALHVPPFDPDGAERILDEAGFKRSEPDGPRVDFPAVQLYIPRGESDMRVARAIQSNLADIGVSCVPLATEWRQHLSLVNSGKAPFFRLGWVADYLDADNFLYYEFHSSNIGVSNSCHYKNVRVDELLDAARGTTDGKRRKELYQEAEQLIANDCVWICLYYYNAALVRQPFVHGLNLTPLGDHMIRFDRVWLEDVTAQKRRLAPSND